MSPRIPILSLAAALLALVLLAPAAADDPACCPGMPAYDKTAEITVTGTVKEIEQPECPHAGLGLHLVIVTAGGASYEAHLGPAAFAEEKGFTFAAGDEVQVTGVAAACCGAEALLARELTREGATLTLRDEDGRPEWAGQMAGSGAGPGPGPGQGKGKGPGPGKGCCCGRAS